MNSFQSARSALITSSTRPQAYRVQTLGWYFVGTQSNRLNSIRLSLHLTSCNRLSVRLASVASVLSSWRWRRICDQHFESRVGTLVDARDKDDFQILPHVLGNSFGFVFISSRHYPSSNTRSVSCKYFLFYAAYWKHETGQSDLASHGCVGPHSSSSVKRG